MNNSPLHPTNVNPGRRDTRMYADVRPRAAQVPKGHSSSEQHLHEWMRGKHKFEGRYVESDCDASNKGFAKADIVELIRLGEEIQRDRRRKVQQRYWKKQVDLTIRLETETQNLRDEIQVMTEEVRNRAIEAAIPARNDFWSVAVQYFNILHHCLRLRTQFSTSAAIHFGALLHFVRATATSDVLTSGGYGPEAVIRSLGVFQWFDDVEMELEDIRKVSSSVLVATTKTRVTITELTLRRLFPNLFNTENAGVNCASMFALAGTLVGQQIVLSGSTSFVWDSASDRVASLITQSDVLAPVLRLIGSLDDVSRVFENALLSPDFH